MTDMQMYAEALVKLGYWFMGGLCAIPMIWIVVTLIKERKA